jgi:SAM-dependent methyltransferase
MIAEACAATPPELAERVRFEVADAARLPFAPGSFDLVVLANMIPFFDELERVVSPGGHVVLMFSGGSQTPIWVPPERLRAELRRRGFTDFADFEADPGTALLARKGEAA